MPEPLDDEETHYDNREVSEELTDGVYGGLLSKQKEMTRL